MSRCLSYMTNVVFNRKHFLQFHCAVLVGEEDVAQILFSKLTISHMPQVSIVDEDDEAYNHH